MNRTRKVFAGCAAASLMLALVALVIVFQGPAQLRAQEGTATPVPTATPEPPEYVAAEAFVADFCRNSYVSFEVRLDGYLVLLDWYVQYEGTAPEPDEYQVRYRIERAAFTPNTDDPVWNFGFDVTSVDRWHDPAGPGHWLYRLAITGVTIDGLPWDCHGDPNWNEGEVYVPKPPTEAEYREFAKEACETVEVYWADAGMEEGKLYVVWEVDADLRDYRDEPYYQDFKVGYNIERRPGDGRNEQWRPVAYVEKGDLAYDAWWAGPAEAGVWVYRVAATAMVVAGQTFQCEGTATWATARIHVLTPAEAAARDAGLQVLQDAAVRCAEEALLSEVSIDATPIARDFVGKKVRGLFDELNTTDDAALVVVKLCHGLKHGGLVGLQALETLWGHAW